MKGFFNEKADCYDEVHLTQTDGGKLSKDVIAGFLDKNTKKILDLGIGTGLELDSIFNVFENVEIVGIDLAKNMTDHILEKYPNKNIKIINDSYFNYDYVNNKFDTVISCQSLHHFNEEEKLALFKSIYSSLDENGLFLNCDYILDTKEELIKKSKKNTKTELILEIFQSILIPH